MSNGLHDWVLFLGRFHPMVVHLPIGALVLLGALELLGWLTRFKSSQQTNRVILGLAAATSVVAAVLGWMLSQAGGYSPRWLPWHKWTGITVAATCTLSLVLSCLDKRRAYQVSLAATLAVLVVAGHLGASLTYGPDFLIRYAPGPLRTWLGSLSAQAAAPRLTAKLSQQGAFAQLIHPVLERRCSACHGPEKHKADVSFESYQTLLKGGKDGPVLIPGKPLDSPMIQRLLLPLDDEDHMPPQGKPQPTLAEIAALQWWIAVGAPADETIDDLKPSPEVQRILDAAR